jgi:hypothetical protein
MQDFKVFLGIYLSSCVDSGNRYLPGQQDQDTMSGMGFKKLRWSYDVPPLMFIVQ